MVDYIKDPTGKSPRTVPKILGQITLLYQRKAEIKLAQDQDNNIKLECSRFKQEMEDRECRLTHSYKQTTLHPLSPFTTPGGQSEDDPEPPGAEPCTVNNQLKVTLESANASPCKLAVARTERQLAAEPTQVAARNPQVFGPPESLGQGAVMQQRAATRVQSVPP